MPSTTECLGIHSGAPFTASLGDGNPPQPQIAELRESFGNAMFGSCVEQLLGGNHLRYVTHVESGLGSIAVSADVDL